MQRGYHDAGFSGFQELCAPAALLRAVDRDLACLVALTLLSACTPPPTLAREPLEEATSSPTSQASAHAEDPSPMTPRAPLSTAECPFHWTPQDLGASVLRIPKDIAGRFMNPLYDAACACVRPGERVQILARIFPERGAIEAVTADRPDPETRADPSIDACLGEVLGEAAFEPFEVGSDVVCPEPMPPPAKTKGPPFFRPPRPAGCPEQGRETSKIIYPLLVDRTEG